MHEAQRDQAVNRLDRIDGVAPGDGYAGFAAYRFAAGQDKADRRGTQHIDRHAHQREGHDRPAAHGVHVGDRIGCGDAPEVIRVVHDGHEEIGRGDEGLLVVEPVNRSVVGGLDPHQQLGRQGQPRRVLENFRQHTRRDLAAAAATVGK